MKRKNINFFRTQPLFLSILMVCLLYGVNTAKEVDTQTIFEEGMEFLQNNQLDKAEENFERVIKRNPDFFIARIKLIHVQILKDDLDDMIKVMTDLLKYKDSDYDGWYEKWDKAKKDKKTENEIKIIQTGIEQAKSAENFLPIVFDMANAYRKAEKFKVSDTILNEIKSQFPDAAQTKYHLLKARLFFDQEQQKEGLDQYWQAVNAISNEMDTNAIFDDTWYLFNSEQYQKFTNASIDSFPVFLTRFWYKKDPNLETEENERISEHYNRLTYSEKNYARNAPVTKSRSLMFTTRHPLKRYGGAGRYLVGDQLLKEIGFAEMIPENRKIDDQGLIYMRHGEPNKTITAPGHDFDMTDIPPTLVNFFDNGTIDFTQLYQWEYGADLSPMNVSWIYSPTSTRDEMVFHFIRSGGETGWVIESVPTVLEGREILGPEYFRLKKSLTITMMTEVALDRTEDDDNAVIQLSSLFSEHSMRLPELINRVSDESREQIKLGLTSETSKYDYDNQPLEFRYDFACFKGDDGENLLEMYYAVTGEKAQLVGQGDSSRVSLHHFITFQTPEGEEKLTINEERDHAVGLTPEEWQQKGLLGLERIKLEPGEYDYEVRIRDVQSNRLGIYKGEYVSTDYYTTRLAMSDVVLLSDSKKATPDDPFIREDIAYTPRMFSDFKVDETVGIYFEVYNLTFDDSKKTNFHVTNILKPRKGENLLTKITGFFLEDNETISSQYDYSGTSRKEKLYINFDLASRPPGRYELTVQVTDKNTGDAVLKKVFLNIIPKNDW